MDYKEILTNIEPAYEEGIRAAKERMDCLIKPLGSLGKLEDIAIQLAGITGKVNNTVDKKCTIVMAADNGICEEGVASTPKEITLIQSINMTKGISGMGALSSSAGADIRVVDVGIDADYEYDKIYHRRIRKGTSNFAKGPAMTREEAEKGIAIGISMVEGAVKDGYQLLGTGEMGIGNTSSTSAVVMALTGLSAELAVGRGGGLNDEAFAIKKRVITEALMLNKPDPDDPVDIVAKVGGFDIAGLVGCFIGAAYYRVPIVIDGVISAVSALLAYRMNPAVRDFIFPSHISMEPAYQIITKELGIRPMLDMDMRLGEGTGCILAFGIIKAACDMMNNMATFEEIKFNQDYRIDNREKRM
jgi:nicotinate-nucleotide--dimethylbenzimidazole phosphoribosyltransferase